MPVITATIDFDLTTPPLRPVEDQCNELVRAIHSDIVRGVYHVSPSWRGDKSLVPNLADFPSVSVTSSKTSFQGALQSCEVKVAMRDACPTVPGDILDHALSVAVRTAEKSMGVLR